jgi:broad specificity phosphatase PhoE
MKTRLLRAALLTLSLVPVPASAQKAVFLVRHAEKVDESDDAALSEAGLARARSLAEWLRSAGVSAIYTTRFQRTRNTAEPLARNLGISPRVVESGDSKELVREIRERNARDVVLVVGHSNTLPEILGAFGHPEPVVIASAEYDNLFVVVPHESGPPVVLRLRY